MDKQTERMARQMRPAVRDVSLMELRAGFEQIDVDKDGYITAAELKTLFVKLDESLSEVEMAEMIRMFDDDGDGRISFLDWMRQFTIQPGEYTTDLANETAKILEDQFLFERVCAVDGPEAADRFREQKDRKLMNANVLVKPQLTGNVSVDLANFVRSLGGVSVDTGLSPAYMKRLVLAFRENDTDNSGELDFNEFCRLINKPTDDVLALAAFSLFDSDKSGTVALRELLLGISAFTTASAEEKLSFAFRLFDETHAEELDRATLAQVINANFVAQGGLSSAVLDRRIQATYRLAGIQATDSKQTITYEQYMFVARTNAGLIFPAYQSVAGTGWK